MKSTTCDDLKNDPVPMVCGVHDDGQRLIVMHDGKPVAAIVSIEDLELLIAMEDQHDRAEIEAAVRETETDGFFAWDDVKAELIQER